MVRSRKPTFLSLFCGCGGLDLGFIQAGFRCIQAFDNDSHALEVHALNLGMPTSKLDLSTSFPISSEWRKVDVLLAGPPCQGFSTAGKRRIDDPRNSLLISTARIAAELQPKVVVIENVAGVLAGNHRKFWDSAIKVLTNSGFRVSELMCNAVNHGVNQSRKRVLAVGWRSDFEGRVELQGIPCPPLESLLANMDGLPNHAPRLLDADSRSAKIAKRIGRGQKLCNVRLSDRAVHTWDIPEVFGSTSRSEREVLLALARRRRQNRIRDYGDADPVTAQSLRWFLGKAVAQTLQNLIAKDYVRRVDSAYDLSHTFNGKFRRLDWHGPAPTVDTKYGDAHYFLHPSEDRAFTVREAARIQGFPDSFVFFGPDKHQFQMVGNAVPPPLALAIAKFLKNTILLR